MTTHSSILAWRIPWTESLRATVHRVTKSQTQLKQLSMHKMPKHSVIKINNILMQYMFNKIFCKKKICDEQNVTTLHPSFQSHFTDPISCCHALYLLLAGLSQAWLGLPRSRGRGLGSGLCNLSSISMGNSKETFLDNYLLSVCV